MMGGFFYGLSWEAWIQIPKGKVKPEENTLNEFFHYGTTEAG